MNDLRLRQSRQDHEECSKCRFQFTPYPSAKKMCGKCDGQRYYEPSIKELMKRLPKDF